MLKVNKKNVFRAKDMKARFLDIQARAHHSNNIYYECEFQFKGTVCPNYKRLLFAGRTTSSMLTRVKSYH